MTFIKFHLILKSKFSHLNLVVFNDQFTKPTILLLTRARCLLFFNFHANFLIKKINNLLIQTEWLDVKYCNCL